jgi:phage-related holin
MDILAFIQALINLDEVKILAILMVANFFSGVLASFVTGTWNWSEMKEIWKRVGGLFGAYLVMSLPAYYIDDWAPVQVGITILLSGFLVEKILANLSEMGIPVPASISQLPVVKQVVGLVGVGTGLVAGLPGRFVPKKKG